jgi:outer membrane protein TolC
MNGIKQNRLYWISLLVLLPVFSSAQAIQQRIIKVDELFALAETNSKTLSISRQNIDLSAQQKTIAEAERLPEINASVDVGYISNAIILNTNFSFNENVPVPHMTNNYGLEGSQLLYNGSKINNNIKKAQLQESLAMLNYEYDRETIRILLLGRYLDLYRLFNQREVYAKNIELAKARLKNIEGLHKEGMVTQNDIIRSKLQITDLNVLAGQVDNNIAIINRELTIVLGLPEDVNIGVDTTLNAEQLEITSYQDALHQAFTTSPAMKAIPLKESIADKNVRIAKADKLPTLSLYANEGLSRPYLYVLPPQDIYFNIYQAGIRLRYNISSIYHSKDKIHFAELERTQQETRSEQVKQQTEMDVHAAVLNYNQAKTEFTEREEAKLLADDNYRIVEKKYLNQLALLTDILDASSAKLSAELNQANAGINIIYRWYQLKKTTGQL